MDRRKIPDGPAQAPAHPRASCDFVGSSRGFLRFSDFISPVSAVIATHAEMTRARAQFISRKVALGGVIQGEPALGGARHPEPRRVRSRRAAAPSGAEQGRERAQGRAESRPPPGASDPRPVGRQASSGLLSTWRAGRDPDWKLHRAWGPREAWPDSSGKGKVRRSGKFPCRPPAPARRLRPRSHPPPLGGRAPGARLPAIQPLLRIRGGSGDSGKPRRPAGSLPPGTARGPTGAGRRRRHGGRGHAPARFSAKRRTMPVTGRPSGSTVSSAVRR